MHPLENDPRNPCIGCGPNNPLGLRLSFAWDGGGATAAFTVGPHHVGWPGSCHTGVLYIALVETCNWTVWGALGRAGFPLRTSALETTRRAPVGERLTLKGRVIDEEGPRVVAEAMGEDGALVARLERTFTLPTPHEVAGRLGFEELPEVLEGMFPE